MTVCAAPLTDRRFDCMGTTCRILVAGEGPAAAAERFLLAAAACLTRFAATSELSRLNRDPRAAVPASPLLRAAVEAAVWAAERTGGLVDPCVADDLVACGYAASRAGVPAVPLLAALADAPPRRAARPRADSPWRDVAVDDDAGVVRRPPGVHLDLGGTAKGLLADAAMHRLLVPRRPPGLIVVDAGGDIRVAAGPIEIDVAHPLGGTAATLTVDGAVATSGIGTRVWRDADGRPAHHLIDPATGAPAWTGLAQATALAPTALEAELLAKAVLLGGPAHARSILRARGGVLVHDDGRVEEVRS